MSTRRDYGHIFEDVWNADYLQVENGGSFYADKDGTKLTLYFECSNGLTDWRNNFDFPATPYRDMNDKWYAHRGFLKVWKSIEPYLQVAISDREITEIEIAGYSHGAAIAVLCTEYSAFNRPDIAANIHGYGFGTPRVIWGKVPQALNDRLKNFISFRCVPDIVTHVPPRILGFHDAGKLIRIGIGDKRTPIKAHYPISYINALKSYAKKE